MRCKLRAKTCFRIHRGANLHNLGFWVGFSAFWVGVWGSRVRIWGLWVGFCSSGVGIWGSFFTLCVSELNFIFEINFAFELNFKTEPFCNYLHPFHFPSALLFQWCNINEYGFLCNLNYTCFPKGFVGSCTFHHSQMPPPRLARARS